MHLFTTLALLVVSSLCLSGEVVRWQDEQGKTHYGDQPPPHLLSSAVPIEGSQSVENGAVDSIQTAPTPPLLAPGMVVTGELPRADAERTKACQQARDNVSLFSNGERLRLRDSVSGEFRFLTDSEREQELARAEQQQRRYCAR